MTSNTTSVSFDLTTTAASTAARNLIAAINKVPGYAVAIIDKGKDYLAAVAASINTLTENNRADRQAAYKVLNTAADRRYCGFKLTSSKLAGLAVSDCAEYHAKLKEKHEAARNPVQAAVVADAASAAAAAQKLAEAEKNPGKPSDVAPESAELSKLRAELADALALASLRHDMLAAADIEMMRLNAELSAAHARIAQQATELVAVHAQLDKLKSKSANRTAVRPVQSSQAAAA